MDAQTYQDFELEHGPDLSLVRDKTRIIDGFPNEETIFCDITPALADPETYERVIHLHMERVRHLVDSKITKVVAMEARGFMVGPVIAHKLRAGLVPARKPGKLPAKTISEDYSLEYAKNTLQIHRDALSKGDRVLIVDDLLATGGTAAAVAKMIEALGAEVVSQLFMVELTDLEGRSKQRNQVQSVLCYTEADLTSELKRQEGRVWGSAE